MSTTKQKRTPGLKKIKGIWHIDKRIRGRRLCESTGTVEISEAERYLAHRVAEIRRVEIYGERPSVTFHDAAIKYIEEATKITIAEDARVLKYLDRYIGKLPLKNVCMDTLELKSYIEDRRRDGVKSRTINYGLAIVRRITLLAARSWRHEGGQAWLESAPQIRLLPERDRRHPYPMTFEEQGRLFKELPLHLANMALFKVNTGCRQAEVCGLKWAWERVVSELHTSVFLLPLEVTKNKDARVVILNDVARSVMEARRELHPTHVFTYEGQPISRMNGQAWVKARNRAGLPLVRVHDLRHTFGRRLRAAGVSFEDRQDLLGHRSGRITTHYSAAELEALLSATNKICGPESRIIHEFTLLRFQE